MTDTVVIEHFDRVARRYESNKLGRWYIAHGRFIADHLGKMKVRSVLDIGCGTGWLLRELVSRGVAERGFGLDISAIMLEEATERARKDHWGKLDFAFCDWPTVDATLASRLRDEPIDLIVCASSAHYFDDLNEAVRTAYSFLRPKGLMLILERAPERSLLTRLWGAAHQNVLHDGVHFHDTESVLAALRNAGFADARVAATLRKLFWKRKVTTSMALSVARKPAAETAAL